MRKLGTSQGQILVSLTNAEFNGLAGKSPSNVPDGTDISLERLRNLVKLVDGNKQEMQAIRASATDLVKRIDGLGL